jgi:hypothetical protein
MGNNGFEQQTEENLKRRKLVKMNVKQGKNGPRHKECKIETNV